MIFMKRLYVSKDKKIIWDRNWPENSKYIDGHKHCAIKYHLSLKAFSKTINVVPAYCVNVDWALQPDSTWWGVVRNIGDLWPPISFQNSLRIIGPKLCWYKSVFSCDKQTINCHNLMLQVRIKMVQKS